MCMIFVQNKLACIFARNTATPCQICWHRLPYPNIGWHWYQGATETGRIFVSDSEGYKFLPQLVDESGPGRGNFESIGQFWEGAKMGGIIMDNRVIV